MLTGIRAMARLVVGASGILAPIIVIIAFFQLLILQRPVENLADIALGLLFVLLGLAIFIQGLEMALFPWGGNLLPRPLPIRAV